MEKHLQLEDRQSTINPNKTNSFNALSFFSGAMGLDIGLHKAGITTLLACEVDKASRKTISANNKEIGLIGDIRNYSVDEILEFANVTNKEQVDLIAGGPPCQAFSTAGKRKGFQDERGNVFIKFIETIEEIKPKYAVIENVRGLLSSKYSIDLSSKDQQFLPEELKGLKGSTMYYVVNRLKDAGYKVSFNLYNSANYGTPQKRERVIIICSLSENPVPHLTPTHSENGEFNLPKWKTFKEAVWDLDTDSVNYIKFPEKRLKYYRLLKPGENWRALPEKLQKEALGNTYYGGGGRTGFFRRLDWDKPSPTLLTHPAMPATDLGHPEEDRPLSVEEYKRVQEFPDDWQIEGSIINKYKQIGNAVPVSVGEAIGREIIKHHKSNQLNGNDFLNFRYSRYKNTSDSAFLRKFESDAKKKLEKSEQMSLFD